MKASEWISDEQAKEAFQIIEGFITTTDSSKYSQESCSRALWIWHEWKKQQLQNKTPMTPAPVYPIFSDKKSNFS